MYYKMNEKTKQNKTNLVNKQLENMQNALNTIDGVHEVLKKFDGKTLNKRVSTALKTVNNNLNFEMSYNSFIITYKDYNNRSVQDVSGVGCLYIQYPDIYLAHDCLKSSDNNGVYQNNVFIYDNIKKILDRKKEDLQKDIKEITSQLKKIDLIEQQRAKLDLMIEGFNNKYHHTIRSYFELTIKN